MSEEQIEALVHAARVNVARGHFVEAYEGFNDCPCYKPEDLDKCDCGYREAVEALRACGIELPEVVGR